MKINRRSTLVAGLGIPVIAASLTASAAVSYAKPRRSSKGSCHLSKNTVDGPYYVNKLINRSDITEGKKGVPLELRVTVLDAACVPILAVRVDCWHADAGGIYSGFHNQGDDATVDERGHTFLRGTQFTDADGTVVFRSIYPGWYAARTAHVHFKVWAGNRDRFTSQMFFPDALSEYIYLSDADYSRPIVRDTLNATDWILGEATHEAMADVKEQADRYVASLTFNIDPRTSKPADPVFLCPDTGPCTTPTPPPPNRVEAMLPSAENGKKVRPTRPGS
jgi:protocatechuate 3,4-dioxygenase beta subunit